jgi:hypothetical protein
MRRDELIEALVTYPTQAWVKKTAIALLVPVATGALHLNAGCAGINITGNHSCDDMSLPNHPLHIEKGSAESSVSSTASVSASGNSVAVQLTGVEAKALVGQLSFSGDLQVVVTRADGTVERSA